MNVTGWRQDLRYWASRPVEMIPRRDQTPNNEERGIWGIAIMENAICTHGSLEAQP